MHGRTVVDEYGADLLVYYLPAVISGMPLLCTAHFALVNYTNYT